MQIQQCDVLTPYENFIYPLKAKETKRQYPHRLDKFLTHLGLEGSIPEKCVKLHQFANDINQLQSTIIKFINVQKGRIERSLIKCFLIHDFTVQRVVMLADLYCSIPVPFPYLLFLV